MMFPKSWNFWSYHHTVTSTRGTFIYQFDLDSCGIQYNINHKFQSKVIVYFY